MKLMNFSFIYALIFIICSLDLIHTSPKPKLDMGKPSFIKAKELDENEKDFRRLDERCGNNNYMIIYLNENAKNTEGKYSFSIKSIYKDDICRILTGTNEGENSNDLEIYTDSSEITLYFSTALKKLDYFFQDSIIKTVDLSHLNFTEITSTENMFQGSSLNTIDLSNINAPKLINMVLMFNNCSELSSVNLLKDVQI